MMPCLLDTTVAFCRTVSHLRLICAGLMSFAERRVPLHASLAPLETINVRVLLVDFVVLCVQARDHLMMRQSVMATPPW